MEGMIQELKNYSRWLKLEKELPQQKEALVEAKNRRIDAAGSVAAAKWELDKLEKPGFFLRLRGGQEEKKAEARREYRDTQIRLQTAKEEETRLVQSLSEMEKEFEALSSSWENYLREKEQAGKGCEEEQTLLIEVALTLIRECLDALENAREYMQRDVRTGRVRPGNRKMEFLALAAEKAQRLKAVVGQLCKETVKIPNYLHDPEHYVTSPTMAYQHLDRLNLAQEQLRELRKKLREL